MNTRGRARWVIGAALVLLGVSFFYVSQGPGSRERDAAGKSDRKQQNALAGDAGRARTGGATKSRTAKTGTKSALLKSLENWSDDRSPAELWDQVKSVPLSELSEVLQALEDASLNGQLRQALMKAVIASCAAQGKFAEVMEVVDKVIAEGPLRDEYRMIVVSRSRDSLQDLAKQFADYQGKGREKIIGGLVFKAKYEKLTNLSELDVNGLPKDMVGPLLGQVGSNIASLPKSQQLQAFDEVLKWSATQPDRVAVLDGFLWRTATSLPFESYAQITSSNYDMSPELRDEIFREMIKTDAARAVATMIGNAQSDPKGKGDLAAFLKGWANSDQPAFEKWFTEAGELPAPVKDAALAAKIGGVKSPKEAWEAVAGISDPILKKQTEGRIWSSEQKQVRREAQENPQGTIEGIVQGRSEHAPYWIETAMNEWVAQDSDAAWKWYQSNAGSLTAEQNEAVALTYARLALRDNNVDAARDWAKQVVTAKFKQKINAEIEAAGH